MKFKFLRVFCDVVRHGSISQAASANKVSQSAASQIVLQLEKRLGVQLIDRSTRPLQPTGAGQAYYEGCRNLIEGYLELEASIRRAQTDIAGTVEVAAIYSVGLGDMGHLVEQFGLQHPNAKVHVEYLHPDRVYDKVLAATVDFGLVSFPCKSRELSVLPWREEEMVLTCVPDHQLAQQRAIKVQQLNGERYVAFDRELRIRRRGGPLFAWAWC